MVDIVHDLMLIALIEIVYSSHVDLKFWDDNMFTSHVHEVCEYQSSNRFDMKEMIHLSILIVSMLIEILGQDSTSNFW